MSATMHARDFIEAFRFALSCAGVKDIRWYLNGVAFEVADGVFRWVGTDGHRMAVVESTPLADPEDAPPVGRYVVKREAVAAMLKAFGKRRPTDLAIVFCEPSDPDGLYVSVGPPPVRTERLALIADARYPDWRRVEPGICAADFPDLAKAYIYCMPMAV